MPTCKNCHREISKFDADICPYCGCPRPIDDNYKTKDMTGFVDPVSGAYKLYKSKSRKAAGFLCLFLGWAGAHDFYLGFRKRAVLELAGTLVFVGGFGSLLAFTILTSDLFIAYAAPFFVAFLVYAIASFNYFTKDSLKDANGEFLR